MRWYLPTEYFVAIPLIRCQHLAHVITNLIAPWTGDCCGSESVGSKCPNLLSEQRAWNQVVQ